MRYEKKNDKKEIIHQGRKVFAAFLRDRIRAKKIRTRRFLVTNIYGAEKHGGGWVQPGDDPEYATDRDEYGSYDFWSTQ